MRRDYMKRNRIQITAGIFLAIVLLLLLRLFVLQIIHYDQLKTLAVSQREVAGMTQNQRGDIYDRNLIPLTDRDEQVMLVIEPEKAGDLEALADTIQQHCDQPKASILKKMQQGVLFSVALNDDGAAFQGRSGVQTVPVARRYSDDGAFSHVLGYANSDNIGVSGIESAFDSVLQGKEQKKVVKIADSKKNDIEGLDFKVTGLNDAQGNVKLTLDYRIQQAVYEAMQPVKKGAAVVVDIESGDILAMVSRPDFDANDVQSYVHSSDGALSNRALLSYNAGSVFKIVVASAALEQTPQVLNQRYHCDGYIIVKGRKVACHKAEGHGNENFSEAFANSCNPAFIETGEIIGKQAIIDLAKKFGFGSKTGILPDESEQAGVVTKTDNNYPLDCANLSIGQGELMVTPLQVASMVVTVASGGEKKQLNLVDSIMDDNGNVIKNMRQTGSERVISSFTAKQVLAMMRKTVTEGTGKPAESELAGGSLGKTGSAETGWYEDGKRLVHGWFAGCFPVDTPKYAVSVFVEGGESGSVAAAPVFKEIADRIAQIGAVQIPSQP